VDGGESSRTENLLRDVDGLVGGKDGSNQTLQKKGGDTKEKRLAIRS